MIDVTLPEEVGQLRSAVESVTADAKRIDLLADDFDIGGVQGVDVTVDDLVLDTNFLEGGLATVTATSGTFNAAFDPAGLPLRRQVAAVPRRHRAGRHRDRGHSAIPSRPRC